MAPSATTSSSLRPAGPPTAASAIGGARLLLTSTVVLMLVLLLASTAELALYMHNPSVPRWQVAAIGLSQVVVVSAWLLFDLRSRRYATPPLEWPFRWFYYHARRLPLLIVGFIGCTYGLRFITFAMFGATYRTYWPITLLYESLKVTLLLCCWLALVFGISSFLQMRAQTEHLLRVEKNLAQAQLSQLKAQLHPHFLFNALNTISAFIHADARRADHLLAQLGDLLRASLANSERTLVTLAEELELLRRYADIMQARFAERVRMEWRIDPDVGNILVPAMLLQPLLENAFKHGVEPDIEPQTIRIEARRHAGALHVGIHNTPSTLSATSGGGLGLSNCRERLQLLYADQASLQLHANCDGGVEVAVILPANVLAP